ncbi:MAG: hypothetical protein WCT85_00680 [Parachlamydiales bacterium]|jgi:hypothetical protein
MVSKKNKIKLETLSLQLVNNSKTKLSVDLFKGVSYVCLPAQMQCVQVSGDVAGIDYDQILAEINSNPIKIKKIKIIANNNQLKNLLYFIKQTSTGAINQVSLSPSSYMSAMQSIQNMVEITLKKAKLINSTRFIRYFVNQNTTVNMVISFYFVKEGTANNFRNFCGIIY